MNRNTQHPQHGFTLVEMMVTVLIISILTAAVVSIGRVVHTNAQIHTTENTIKIIRDALTQYQASMDKQDGQFYFPVRPENPAFSSGSPSPNAGLVEALNEHFYHINKIGTAVPPATMYPNDHANPTWKDSGDLLLSANNEFLRARCTIEFIYCVLNDVPACKAVLENLPNNAVVNQDKDNATVADRPVQFVEIIDAWGHPIRYESTGSGNFPILRSAGSDAAFNTADDIVSTDF